jgi:ferric-dicitrate binding protein FerR (iron transport regulator)
MATVLCALAQKPVATITCSKPFNLNGSTMSAVGVSSWPLAIGDQITTLKTPAVVRFSGDTRLVLDKGAQLKLEGNDRGTAVRLTSGAMRFRIDPKARVEVFAGNERVDVRNGDENGVSVHEHKVHKSKQEGPPKDEDPGKPHHKPEGRSDGE